jgi:hypothetical protein
MSLFYRTQDAEATSGLERLPLEQVTAAARPVATTLPVLLELRLDCPEKIFAHQPRDFDDDLIFR